MATRIDMDVTPTVQCDELVLCDIDGTPNQHFTDGVIFLDYPGDYELKFTLRIGPKGQYNWDQTPFCAQRGRCPPTGQGMPQQFSSVTVNGSKLTVTASGVRGRSAIHFRLNMTDPDGKQVYCDPIMINT
jgi:hypothetical protein